MTYTEKGLIESIDGLLPGGLAHGTTPDALKFLDQYHVGGSLAVERLLHTLELSPTDNVLDIGSGFGGPARQLAATTGCHVTGVDITAAYVEAAIELTDKCGLSDRVQFVLGDISEYVIDHPFDAGYTMHVQMNVAAKKEWFAAIAQRLAPGARFAVWEICRTSNEELLWPQPWSIDGSDSHLSTSGDLCGHILGAGFELIEWVDETAWTNSWIQTTFASNVALPPALPMLIDDGLTRILNLVAALTDGTAEVWRGAFVRSSN